MKTIAKLAILALLVLITQNCRSIKLDSSIDSNLDNDWVKAKLKGAISSYTKFSYKALYNGKGAIEKGDRKKIKGENDIQVKYDRKGNKVERNLYSLDDSLVHKQTYKYDLRGNITEHNYIDSSIEKYTYKYDEKGNQIEKNEYLDGDLKRRYWYKYNDRGDKIEMIDSLSYFDRFHKKNGKWIYNYEKGNKIQEEYYLGGILEKKTNYKYDVKGNMIVSIDSVSIPGLVPHDLMEGFKRTFKYDDKGNEIENTRSFSSVLDIHVYFKNSFNYNEKSKPIKYSNYIDDVLVIESTLEYDKKGDLIEMKAIDLEDSLLVKTKYLYDKQRNWIKKIEFINTIPTSIVERKINYF